MKSKSYLRILNYFIIITLFLSSISGASMPESFKITTGKENLYTVQYNDYDLTAKKISIEGSNNIAYCLEINRSYPSGQNFSISESTNEKIRDIIAAGYPNRSVSELNLSSENEAYFATQIALWSFLSDFDVTIMKGENPQILEAIKMIYNDGMNAKYPRIFRSEVYKTNNASIQDVIVISYEDLVSEEKGELIQAEYPPQEG